MNFIAAIIAIVAFSIGLILGWDAGFTTGVIRALFIGLIALSVAVVIPGGPWPWTHS